MFLTGDPASAGEHGRLAHEAGASIVDLTGTLQGRPGVLLRSPWTGGGTAPDLATVAVSVPHPAALMLGTAAARLQTFGLRRMAATVLEPASQYGTAGVDELHQQTVGLLSFKPLEQVVFDAQVAFNLRASLGSAAKRDLATVTTRIGREAAELSGGNAAEALTVQVLQAPVFHGTTASVFVELTAGIDEAALRKALAGEGFQVSSGDEPVSNESVSGKGEVAVSIRLAQAPAFHEGSPTRETAVGATLWLWMAADNLRLAARTAASCAAELAALRPASRIN